MNRLKVGLKKGDVIRVEGYSDPTGLFRVSSGFGTSTFTAGQAIFGTWLSDGREDRVEGRDVVELLQTNDPRIAQAETK